MNRLELLFTNILPGTSRVIVYPNIEKSSKFNPYLSLLYKGLSIKTISGNPANPFSPLAYSIKSDIVHYHWLEITSIKSLVTVFLKVTPLILFRLRGGTLVWTLHNIEPHTKRWLSLNRYIHRIFGTLCSKVIVHSDTAKERVVEKFGFTSDHVAVIEHPKYEIELPDPSAVDSYRKRNALENPYVLMFGYIASYKGIIEMIKYFSEQNSPVDLVIAGSTKKGDEQYVAEVKRLCNDIDNVHLINQFISREDEALLFRGASASLFNFHTILTSGSLMLSYSYGTKIICNAIPSALPEQADCVIFSSPEELTVILEELHCE